MDRGGLWNHSQDLPIGKYEELGHSCLPNEYPKSETVTIKGSTLGLHLIILY